jgi:hypothetical protein
MDTQIKFTKEEKTKLTFQINENVKYLSKKIESSWFLTKWFYKNMFNQYQNILSTLNN